jgi:hypothetical protein
MEKTSNLVYFKNDSGHAERGALSAGKLPYALGLAHYPATAISKSIAQILR